MKTNQKGIDILHEFEGCKLEAYLCPAKIWTIGYGNTFYADGSPVKQGDKITIEQAKRLFDVILARFENQVRKLVTSDINHNQFSALVSFTYNVGVGNFTNSTLRQMVNANPNSPNIREQFIRWNKAGGQVMQGLIRRRTAEANLYFS